LIATHLTRPFAVEFDDRVLDGELEVFDGWEGAVGKETTLQIAPGPLDVIELGRVFRQPLDGQPGSFGDRRTGEPVGMDRAVVEHQHDRHDRPPRFWSVVVVELFQQGDEVGAAFAGADMHDQFAAPWSSTPSSARLRAWPGAGTRRSAPRLAQACARYGCVNASVFAAEQQHDVPSDQGPVRPVRHRA